VHRADGGPSIFDAPVVCSVGEYLHTVSLSHYCGRSLLPSPPPLPRREIVPRGRDRKAAHGVIRGAAMGSGGWPPAAGPTHSQLFLQAPPTAGALKGSAYISGQNL